MTTGRAAVFVEPYHFEMTELPPVPVEPGGIRVQVTSAGVCGSDLHFWRGELKPIGGGGKPGPIILGHEISGAVSAMASDVSTDSMGRPLKEGDRVAFPYFFPCRRCYNCVRGEFNHCPGRFRFRASIEEFPYCNGGFSEYYYLFPGHFVFKVPDELPDEAVTSANCAVSQVIYGLHQSGLRMGDIVVVQGAGGLGISAAAAAKEMGASAVISIDGLSNRLELARQCGADETIDIREFDTSESRIERVKALTEGRGADVVVEVAGIPQVVPEGIEMLRNGGTYVEVGNIWPQSNATLDMSKLIWRMARIVPTAHYDPYTLPVALDFLARTRDKYPLTKIMSHSFPLERIEEAFRQAEWSGKSEETAVTRAVLVP